MNDKEFIGRHEQLEVFNEFLNSDVQSKGENGKYARLLLVVGYPGLGKKALLQKMKEQADEQGHYCFFLDKINNENYRPKIQRLIEVVRKEKRPPRVSWTEVAEVATAAASSTPAAPVGKIGSALLKIIKRRKAAKQGDNPLAYMLLEKLKKLSTKIPNTSRIVIFIYPEENALNPEEENPKELIQLLNSVGAEVPDRARFVIAQRPQSLVIKTVNSGQADKNLINMCAEPVQVGKMEKDESEAFIRQYDTGHILNEAMTQVFLEIYGGWPRLMELALDELQKEPGEITEEIIRGLPKEIDDFWESRYKEIRDNKPEAALNVVQTVSLLPHPYEYDDVELFSKLEPVAMERVAIKDAPVNRYLEIKDWPDLSSGKPWKDCPQPIHATAKEYVVNLLKNSRNKRIYRQRLDTIISHYSDKINKDGYEKTEDRDALWYLFPYMMEAESWDKLGNLLANIAYLTRMQSPQEQYHFQNDFISLINNEEIPNDKLVKILKRVLNTVREQLPTSNEKADWLDIFALWINEFGIKDCTEKSLALKDVANKFDYACGDVSKELADDYLKKGESSFSLALRFAELCTWVYEQAGDYSKCVDAYRDAEEMGLQEGMEDAYIECVKACRYAEGMCLQKGMEDAYRYLGQAEFIRLRAHAFTILSNKIATDESKKTEYKREAHEAYEQLNEVFPAEGGESQWPGVKDWEELEELSGKTTNKVLTPPSQSGSGQSRAFRAKVVSNLADSVSAMHVIQFFEEQGGLVEWIHNKNFKLEQFAPEDTLFTVLIGGPKSSGISKVAFEFYETDKENFIDMFSGLSFKAHRLHIEKHIEKDDKTHCYMLGGASKVFTLKAAYEFTKDDEVTKIIKKGQPSNE